MENLQFGATPLILVTAGSVVMSHSAQVCVVTLDLFETTLVVGCRIFNSMLMVH